MKAKITLFLTVFLIFICCIGATSAADDINDNTLTTDNDVVNVEQATDDVDLEADSSEDTILEINNDEELLEATTPTVSTWADLASNAGASGSAKTIYLASGKTFTPTSQIVFGNSATIIGTPTSYISGTYSGIPFKNTNTALSITFKNVNFKDISCTMLMQMLTTGNAKTTLEGCTFTNVNASSSGHNSVIYNNQGTMDITDCTFSNCRAAFGVITNHNAGSTTNVILNVKNSKFENNYGYTEPGAINNCGQLTVYNSTFVGNHAVWWAGAIHTHSNANTLINKSTFKSNTAGWNGGALFTYSVLKVYDSVFEDNNCSTNNDGGAIGAYNYGSQFDILIDNCTFKKNNNLNSNGRGGAIGTLNGGYLNVYNSIFIANGAKTGQAIAAANSIVENGTSDKPRLAITGNKFINHTGSGDTVYINGRVSSFTNNIFINSTQNTHYGSGNTYNSIIATQSKNNDLLGVSATEILSANEIEVSNNQELSDAFCDFRDGDTILVSDGTYNIEINFDDLWSLDDGLRFILIGTGDNVIFDMIGGYNLDSPDGAAIPGYNNVFIDVTHNNINFDCDVIVGSKNYKFINCTFNKGFKITHNYSNSDTYYQTIDITFDNCKFLFNKDDIQTMDYANLIFNDCTFPVTAVNSNINIVSNEKGIVIINLTDIEGNPIANADVSYTIGTTNATGTTSSEGIITIPNLKGVIEITANYTGNDSYLASNNSASFIFKYDTNITTAVSGSDIIITLKNDENNALTNTNVTYTINGVENTTVTDANGTITLSGLKGIIAITAKYAGDDLHIESNTTADYTFKYNTTLTAPKVSTTYNVAKKLVITLKDENGNAIEGKNVTVKVGTISKNLKTDKNGQISINVATLVPKSYTATFSFAGDDLFNTKSATAKVVVSKATPKLTTKKLTTKVKVKTKKVTATLKDNKGKVLKNTKVTLKIKGKTYTAKTNKKGVATFKVTKLNKKGTFKGTVKFAGNKYFKAISKKVTVVVKK